MFRPYLAIIRPYYKNRFIHFQYILGSQIVYKGGMILQCCVILFLNNITQHCNIIPTL